MKYEINTERASERARLLSKIEQGRKELSVKREDDDPNSKVSHLMKLRGRRGVDPAAPPRSLAVRPEREREREREHARSFVSLLLRTWRRLERGPCQGGHNFCKLGLGREQEWSPPNSTSIGINQNRDQTRLESATRWFRSRDLDFGGGQLTAAAASVSVKYYTYNSNQL